jgi:hypothetical protein
LADNFEGVPCFSRGSAGVPEWCQIAMRLTRNMSNSTMAAMSGAKKIDRPKFRAENPTVPRAAILFPKRLYVSPPGRG